LDGSCISHEIFLLASDHQQLSFSRRRSRSHWESLVPFGEFFGYDSKDRSSSQNRDPESLIVNAGNESLLYETFPPNLVFFFSFRGNRSFVQGRSPRFFRRRPLSPLSFSFSLSRRGSSRPGMLSRRPSPATSVSPLSVFSLQDKPSFSYDLDALPSRQQVLMRASFCPMTGMERYSPWSLLAVF